MTGDLGGLCIPGYVGKGVERGVMERSCSQLILDKTVDIAVREKEYTRRRVYQTDCQVATSPSIVGYFPHTLTHIHSYTYELEYTRSNGQVDIFVCCQVANVKISSLESN